MSADQGGELYLYDDKVARWGKPKRWQRTWTYEAVMSWERSAERAGFHVVHTAGRPTTVRWLKALHDNWSKAWDEHNSFFGIRLKELPADFDPLNSFMVKVDRKMKVAKSLLEGIGDERAKAAAAHFRSVRAMVNADEREWFLVDGFGKKLAASVVAEVTKES